MNVRGFLEAQRHAGITELQSAIERGSGGRTNSVKDRMELIDWLLDGADDMIPVDLRETLEDVSTGKRQVHGLQAPAHTSNELLRRLVAQFPEDQAT